jgi:predicted outer membrane protein
MKRAMVYVVLIVVSLGALMSGAWARSEQTKQFVHEAAKAGIAEVKLGQMATEQAVSPDVQQFGQRMVSDYIVVTSFFRY